MIKQSSKPNKMYSVEVVTPTNSGGVSESCIYAQSPRDALVFAMRKHGYNINRNRIESISNTYSNITSAKICLLGKTRESISYFKIL